MANNKKFLKSEEIKNYIIYPPAGGLTILTNLSLCAE